MTRSEMIANVQNMSCDEYRKSFIQFAEMNMNYRYEEFVNHLDGCSRCPRALDVLHAFDEENRKKIDEMLSENGGLTPARRKDSMSAAAIVIGVFIAIAACVLTGVFASGCLNR